MPVEVKHWLDSQRAQRRGQRAPKRKPETMTFHLEIDEGPRADTSLEALAKLKPAFHVNGTVTAGNSSQMSDGAAAIDCDERDRARALGLKPLARFVSFATAGCLPEELGIGPGVTRFRKR